jgi:AraC-like DNA-binding protein
MSWKAPSRSASSATPADRLWHRFAIHSIDDLANAVFGAELEPVQMAGPLVRGSLAFAARGGVVFSSGLIEGRVALRGPVSRDAITLAIGLRFGPNSRLCLDTVRDGEVGVILPGDQPDASLTAGSLYVTATLSAQRLMEEADRHALVLDRGMISRTGRHPQPIAQSLIVSLTTQVTRIHRPETDAGSPDIGGEVLRTVIEHYRRVPAIANTRTNPAGRAGVVLRARKYIEDHLAAPLTLDAIANGAGTSRPTLVRAFEDVLDDTPGEYVRRLRLHRIRRDLASPGDTRHTISMIAERWGMNEPERMTRWYCALFGESPSVTRAAALAHQRLATERI